MLVGANVTVRSVCAKKLLSYTMQMSMTIFFIRQNHFRLSCYTVCAVSVNCNRILYCNITGYS